MMQISLQFLCTAALAICVLTASGCAKEPTDSAVEAPEAKPMSATISMRANDWQVIEIDGEPTVADALPTLQFPEDGRLAGTSGCNRYFSSFEMDGDKVTIGNAGATMMACPEPLMQQERAFFTALAEVVTYELTAAGELLLNDAAGKHRLRAQPYVEAPVAESD